MSTGQPLPYARALAALMLGMLPAVAAHADSGKLDDLWFPGLAPTESVTSCRTRLQERWQAELRLLDCVMASTESAACDGESHQAKASREQLLAQCGSFLAPDTQTPP